MAHAHGTARAVQQRALWIALGLNATYMVVEIVGGLAFNSLALIADAGHMLSDVVALAIALFAQWLLSRPASTRLTFGFQRGEVLGALINGAALVAVVGWIIYEGVERLRDPQVVDGTGLLLVAIGGLAVNAASAVILSRAQGASLNMRGAFIHMVADAAGSVGVIGAGILVIAFGATWADAIASFAIAVLILWATWGLLRDTVQVLMEGVPRGMDVQAVENAIAEHPGVSSVHHLHLWNIASDVPALSGHVVLSEDMTLHDAQEHGDILRELLHERFGIDHVTLELECHPCVEVGITEHA